MRSVLPREIAPVDEKYVRPSVAIIVNNRGPAPGRLDDVLLRYNPAIDIPNCDAGLTRHIHKPRWRWML